jgi:hypothetical protein
LIMQPRLLSPATSTEMSASATLPEESKHNVIHASPN